MLDPGRGPGPAELFWLVEQRTGSSAPAVLFAASWAKERELRRIERLSSLDRFLLCFGVSDAHNPH